MRQIVEDADNVCIDSILGPRYCISHGISLSLSAGLPTLWFVAQLVPSGVWRRQFIDGLFNSFQLYCRQADRNIKVNLQRLLDAVTCWKEHEQLAYNNHTFRDQSYVEHNKFSSLHCVIGTCQIMSQSCFLVNIGSTENQIYILP